MKERQSRQGKTAETARLAVKVQPNASRSSLIGKTDQCWKLALTDPPVEGRANQACIKFLSKVLGVSRASLQIVRGESSRLKTIVVNGLSLEEAEKRLRGAAKAGSSRSG